MDYSLCDETVTHYRRTERGITRQVLEHTRLIRQIADPTEHFGKSRLKKFLLIIPGDVDAQPGDRIYDGVGPETADWDRFLPDLDPRVYEIGQVKPCLWDGEICHVRATQ